MPIVRSSPTGRRGPADAKRHRQKQRENIKKILPDIISEENIITERKGKKIKVPIRGIIIPDLRPGARRRDGDDEGDGEDTVRRGGPGQGKGKIGDVIGSRSGNGKSGGKGAGDEPGEDFIETEIDIEEIVEMMYEDLGLPNLEKKEVAELEVILGLKLAGIVKSGPFVLMDKNKSAENAIGRFFAYLGILVSNTELDELTCFSALVETGGDLSGAFELLEDSQYVAEEEEVVPFPIFEDEDLRFFDFKERTQNESNAVIIIELDVSGSMGIAKKYLARSMAFWLTEFLRKLYNNVDVRFIIYHSTAKIVDEYTAFHTGESGGTIAREAHDKVMGLIESQYPTDRWNVYVFQFSDGWDFNPEDAVEGTRKLIEEYKINMFGYVEIHVDELFEGWSNLYDLFGKKLPLQQLNNQSGLQMLGGMAKYPFIAAKVLKKEDIWPIIQELLRRDRWS